MDYELIHEANRVSDSKVDFGRMMCCGVWLRGTSRSRGRSAARGLPEVLGVRTSSLEGSDLNSLAGKHLFHNLLQGGALAYLERSRTKRLTPRTAAGKICRKNSH